MFGGRQEIEERDACEQQGQDDEPPDRLDHDQVKVTGGDGFRKDQFQEPGAEGRQSDGQDEQHRLDDHEQDRDEVLFDDRPGFDGMSGMVECFDQAVDAVGRKIEGQNKIDNQEAAARTGDHIHQGSLDRLPGGMRKEIPDEIEQDGLKVLYRNEGDDGKEKDKKGKDGQYK